jgi:hypothetical protein
MLVVKSTSMVSRLTTESKARGRERDIHERSFRRMNNELNAGHDDPKYQQKIG